MFDQRGFIGHCWRLAWPALFILLRYRHGEHALRMPRRRTRHYEYWRANLYQVLRRRISKSPGESTMLAIGVASLYLGTAIYMPAQTPIWASLLLLSFYGYLFFTGVFYAAYLSLRAAAPVDYAVTVLEGRSEHDAIVVTAYEILSFCEGYLAANEQLSALIDSEVSNDEAARHGIKNNGKLIRTQLDGLICEAQAHCQSLERIGEMKKLLAVRLAIPHRKLCDHVLRFSPLLQRTRCRKLIDNWESILSLVSESNSPENYGPRLRQLMRVNREMSKAVENTRSHQEVLLDNEELLPTIRKLAAQHSTSGSIVTYARGLSMVATEIQRIYNKLTSQDMGEQAKGELDRQLVERKQRFSVAIKLLFEKQKAHPGMQPHEACKKIVDEIEGVASDPLSEFLDCIESGTESEISQYAELQNIGYLSRLGSLVSAYITKSRAGVAEHVLDWVRARVLTQGGPNETRPHFLVTCGYSKTVRDAFVRVLTDDELAGAVRIFVVSARRSRDDDLDARRMVSEINQVLDERQRDRVGRGRGEALASLASSEPLCVSVVLGAEFYAQDCVIHARMDEQPIESLRGKLSGDEIAFAAESFKFHPNNLLDSTFFRFHMDQLAIYQPPYLLINQNGRVPVTGSPQALLHLVPKQN